MSDNVYYSTMMSLSIINIMISFLLKLGLGYASGWIVLMVVCLMYFYKEKKKGQYEND